LKILTSLEKIVILRYLKSKKDSFLNIISIFSFIGISLGVAVLIIVMSVMNGFRSELINKIVGFNAHIIIKPNEAQLDFEKFKNKKIKELIKLVLLSNDGEAVLINKNYTKGILLRGYKSKSFKKLDLVKKKQFLGNKRLIIKHISISKELSFILNVKIGDKVSLMSPSGIETIVGSFPKQETYIVDSLFDSGLLEFDKNVAFINILDLENLFNLSEKDRFLEIYLKKPDQIEKSKQIFLKEFNDELIYSWSDLNKSLFAALKIERNVMFIILSLIIIVAAFNIISGLTILVKNKTKEIAILKSIGVRNSSIKKIFFFVGFSIGLFATIFGIFLGIIFSIYVEEIRVFISDTFGFSIFPEEIYFLSKMPSEINLKSISLIGFVSILITSIVSMYPASKASKLDPVKSLKYE
tara:strand:- start:238 stop:1470 length:1233 start_codon:yes stop_codon:yes gene_type:complete